MELQVLEIKKRYGSVQAVDGISLTASPGKIYGLLGPNGAGKTTTIRMIMNIIVPETRIVSATFPKNGVFTGRWS
jgi:ABC-2 type transport system ATP-binding protein